MRTSAERMLRPLISVPELDSRSWTSRATAQADEAAMAATDVMVVDLEVARGIATDDEVIGVDRDMMSLAILGKDDEPHIHLTLSRSGAGRVVHSRSE